MQTAASDLALKGFSNRMSFKFIISYIEELKKCKTLFKILLYVFNFNKLIIYVFAVCSLHENL
jgi:hypothetical protein